MPNVTAEIAKPIRQDPALTETKLHELVAEALKHCSRFKTREQVARELAELTALRVTTRILNDWAAPSKSHIRIPAVVIEPLSWVTATPALQRAVIGKALNELIDRGARLLELQWVIVKLREELDKLMKQEGRSARKARNLRRP